MRIVRVEHRKKRLYAEVVQEGTTASLGPGTSLRPWSAAPWQGGHPTAERIALSDCTLLAPVEPTKIVCVGRNYAAHAKELGNEVPKEPLLFLKPPSAIIAPGDAIVRPSISERVEHEAELGVVIGKRLKDATSDEARAAIFGVTCVNDVTARDLQKKDVQFTRAKGFDSFCPVGPVVVTGLELDALVVRARVNGELRQDGNTRDMVFPVADLIAFMSRVMTLEPSDLISTGTPEGVGPLRAGDVVQIEVEGVGVLENPVR
jgi:2-keto-4-pentenoate hydratase/2-oxohepta-3-ene-1,7-dioic acid hydratase in catechol pathway